MQVLSSCVVLAALLFVAVDSQNPFSCSACKSGFKSLVDKAQNDPDTIQSISDALLDKCDDIPSASDRENCNKLLQPQMIPQWLELASTNSAFGIASMCKKMTFCPF